MLSTSVYFQHYGDIKVEENVVLYNYKQEEALIILLNHRHFRFNDTYV